VMPLARAQGVAVFAGLDLHQAAWMSPRPDWVSAGSNPSSTAPSSSGLVDVLHPEFQQAVSRVVDDLCRTGIDGLVLRARMRKGFAGEVSQLSKAVFEAKFGQPAEGDSTSPSFWRWAGWKARSYLRFAEQLKDQARRDRSTRVMAITVHANAVLDPKAALMDYGEDVLESRLRGFEVVVLPEAGTANGAESGLAELRRRLASMTQGERPLWLGTTLTLSDPELIPAAINETLTALSDQPAVALVLMNEAAVP
jgi:hypothetical protein